MWEFEKLRWFCVRNQVTKGVSNSGYGQMSDRWGDLVTHDTSDLFWQTALILAMYAYCQNASQQVHLNDIHRGHMVCNPMFK